MNTNTYNNTNTRNYPEYNGYSMFSYLQVLIPMMLEDMKGSRDEEWDKVLERMIFLWRESNDDTCTRKNPYEEEFEEAKRKFDAEHPFEIKGETFFEMMQYARAHVEDIPTIVDSQEHQELLHLYLDQERKLAAYRRQCKDEAMNLLKKNFYNLWK